MTYRAVITPDELAARLDDPDWAVVDCRFDLNDTAAGERAYLQAHIPGAVYAHLDRDLSGPPRTDNGRHPLPAPAALTQLFGRLGIGDETQVVAYDDAGGAYAGRLWWMLRYMGHEAAAVLDGGWPAWQAAGLPARPGRETRPASVATATVATGAPRREMLVLLDEAAAAPLLIDARAPERYRGEIEPLDARPGHIPGALNRPYAANWDANGRWRPADELRREYEALLGDTPPEEAVFYCGSGVSACVNLLAMAHAGLPVGRLYVGSWSEWSRDPSRPAALGEE